VVAASQGQRRTLGRAVAAKLQTPGAVLVVQLAEHLLQARGESCGLLGLQRGGRGGALLWRQPADRGPAMREEDGDFRASARRRFRRS
jgi:hypothetical protein